MKIKKLKLHNIASIENAEINFDDKPLNDTDLFLITGATGSGKTTILDGISLALYNTTPRIAACKNKKENINRDNLASDDPRNIMRANTGYAFSKLWFTGNDGIDYCATWSVERGTERLPEQNLTNATWELERLDNGESVTSKTKTTRSEVGDKIIDVVGLDFNQFRRTTMLAQGEFTEFLKSDETTKAAILEKISGTEIYRKIGIEIHRQYNRAKQQLDDAVRQNAAIKPMEKEKREEKDNRFAFISKEVIAHQEEISRIGDIIDWLEKLGPLVSNIATWTSELETAQKAVSGEDFKAKDILSKEWNDTAENRERYRAALEEKAKHERANKELENLESDFIKALSGEAHLKDEHNRLETEKKRIKSELTSQDANSSAYRNAQTVISNLKSMNERKAEIAESEKALKTLKEEDRPKAIKKAEVSAQEALKDQKEAEKAEIKLNEVNQKLELLNLSGLRARKDLLKDLVAIKDNIEKDQNDISGTEVFIKEKNEELKQKTALQEEEKNKLTLLQEEHNRRYQTIESATLKLRQVLHDRLGSEDNICPVCGQIVTSIQSDEIFAEEYRSIQEEYNAQADKYQVANKAVIELGALISIKKEELESQKDKLKADNATLESLDPNKVWFKYSKDELIIAKEEVAEQITAAEAVEKSQKDLQEEYRNLSQKYSASQQVAKDDANVINLIDTRIDGLNSSIADDTKKADELRESIGIALDGSLSWTHNWMSDPVEFIEELNSKAEAYAANENRLRTVNNQITATTPVLSSICSIKEKLTEKMPHWSTDNVTPQPVKDIQNLWVTLSGKVESQLHARNVANESYKSNMQIVHDFIGAHPEYTLDRYNELNMISLNEKETIEIELNNTRNRVNIAKSQLNELEKQRNIHLKKTPKDLAEDANLEVYTAEKERLSRERDEMNVEMGIIQAELEFDDKVQKQKAANDIKIKRLESEFEKWKRFDKIYGGDSNGDKLSKIAQSFILGNLLNTANIHLQNMAPRYKLLVNPGTLYLKLEDKYNGFATRSTSSISGGESFLVSLALALALADFGQHLGVSTLFIDEGFGTLSGDALQSAINTLKALHSDAGRQVGIISHREEIRESIPVHIKVKTQPGTSVSTLQVGIRNDDE